MNLNGFNALLFVQTLVQPAPEVLAEIKRAFFTAAFCPLILRLQLLRNAI